MLSFSLRSRASYISKSSILRWSSTLDRRGLPALLKIDDLVRAMCDSNWFTNYTTTMYYTNLENQGLQVGVGIYR